MPHIIIDGYNYINRIRNAPVQVGANLEVLRKHLLDRLLIYKKQRPNRITVVFDAYKGYSLNRQNENYKGIEVVYTKENETADDVIIEWIRSKKSGIIVVTSDRAIIDVAKQYGVAFITPVKMDEAIEVKPKDKDIDDEYRQTDKKGNPRRLPKKLRRIGKTVSKL